IEDLGTINFLLDRVDPNPEIADGDKPPAADSVTKAERIGGLCGIGSVLVPASSGTPAGSCDEIVGFVTDDSRRPLDPDKDYGLWHIFLDHFITHNKFDATKTSDDIELATVAVLDPGVPNPIPEPATPVLFLTALTAV